MLDSEDEGIGLSDRCWIDPDCDGRVWMTDFPPPPGFDGYQSCEWGDPEKVYKRECTPEEAAVLEADYASASAAERSGEEELRDAWFEMLRSELPSTTKADPEQNAGERCCVESQRAPASGSPQASPTDVTERAESNSPELRERAAVTASESPSPPAKKRRKAKGKRKRS